MAQDVGVDAPRDPGMDLMSIEVTPDAPLCTPSPSTRPSNMVIANFDDQTDTTFGQLGLDPVIGQTYVTNSILPDFSQMDWHIMGDVADDATFFGLWWNCIASPTGGCSLDVSQYKGISFTIAGPQSGPAHQIMFTMGRTSNDAKPENAGCGSCVAAADASVEASCRGPRIAVDVPTNGTPVTKSILWTEFTGGRPMDGVDPMHVTGFLWFFPPPATPDGGTGADSAVPQYPVDIRIDNIQFMPNTGTGG
jgi:hypothetical protein